MARILVVDDEKQITRILSTALRSIGYEVVLASNGREGYERFNADKPNLIITDLSMPEMDGVQLTRAVRKESSTPIIVLSVRNTDSMKILALDEGADDYLTKPFSMPELLARVRAQLRRSTIPEPPATHFEVGDFVLDTGKHSASLRGEELHLTPKEFDLLTVFLRNPDCVLTHKVLLNTVWGPGGDQQPEYLRVLVAQLRKKLGKEGGPRYIESEPWVGYRLLPNG